MKRAILMSVLLVAAAGTASADYVLIKINMNQLSFFPPGSPPDDKGKGPPGKDFDPKKPPPPPPVPPKDPNPRWISAYVEIRNRPLKATFDHPWGWYKIFTYDHPWSKHNNLMIMSEMFPIYGDYVAHESFNKEFSTKFTKAKSDKDGNIKGYLDVARLCLARGRVKEFHEVMQEAEKIDPKDDHVKQYLRVKKVLQNPFKDEDPAQLDLLTALRAKDYKPFNSKGGHYRIYAKIPERDTQTAVVINRRLALMEETMETFYYWFALREEPELLKRPLKLPRYRLNAIVTVSSEEFQFKYAEWGQPPMVGDGFTPRRENVMVLSAKSRLHDPLFSEYDALITAKIEEANKKLKEKVNLSFTREDLLSGKLSDAKKYPAAVTAMANIAVAQAAVLLAKTLESEAERHTVTHETIRQLLIASEMFPRHVQVPDWVIEGLAAFFETPPDAVYPTIGATSWTNLISFKYFDKAGQLVRLENPKVTEADVLNNVVTDAYFIDARQQSKKAHDSPGAQKSARDAWELARCSSWGLIYYLSEKKKLHYLLNYADELDKLPRDLDLNYAVLQTTFGKAFKMADPRDPRQLDGDRMKTEASRWFDMIRAANMDGANREILKIQANYEQKRATQ
jgi:Protein of unknown function (DUF1570)